MNIFQLNIYLDVPKCIGLSQPSILLCKFELYGIAESAYKLLQKYIKKRKQKICTLWWCTF